MSASMGHDEWVHNDRADVWTLEQARVVLGDRYEDFARDLAAGAVPSMLAVMTAGAVRPVAVTAGAIADWLHGRIPAAVYPDRTRPVSTVAGPDGTRGGTSMLEVPPAAPEPMVMTTMEAERLMACLRTDVARWAYQDRIDDGVAADLGHYLQRLQDVVDGLVAAGGVGSTDTPADRKGVRSVDTLLPGAENMLDEIGVTR